ncbi:hypothetical protein DL96DRAFT_1608426 [Flagelloscypha sp. PMI_526]|nr:hypothetical protein DL96DRAFT_1608426 [Flagelloscypha sp. PMI_526]
MNPTEAAFLSSYARGVIGNIFLIVVTTVFYSFYLILFPLSAIILFRRKRSTSTLVMFCLTFLLFVVTSCQWVSLVAQDIILLRVGFVDLPGSNIIAQFQKAQAAVQWIFSWENWPQPLNFAVNDAILVWRVHCLFPHNRLVKIFTTALGLGSVVTCLTYSIYNAVADKAAGAAGPTVNVLSGYTSISSLRLAYWILSFLTNVACTGVIGWIAWQHRRVIQEKSATTVQKVLALLVESGVLFIVVQILMITFGVIDVPVLSPTDIVARSITHAAIVCSAIVPTLVIVIVSRDESLAAPEVNHPNVSTLRAATGSALTGLTQLTTFSSMEGRTSQIDEKDSADFVIHVEEQVPSPSERRLWRMPTMTGSEV